MYGQKLIFEGFNELNNGNYNSTPSTSEIANVNSLNQAFVTAVRNSGGENKKNQDRVLILNGYNADIDNTVNGFAKPDDKTASNVIIENRLMLSVHYYDPYDFALNENGTDMWDEETGLTYMQTQMQKISSFANSLNVPVFIGEYGAIDKDNELDRETYISSLNTVAESYNIVTAYWDNGNTGEYGFALFDRETNSLTEIGEILISAITKSYNQ